MQTRKAFAIRPKGWRRFVVAAVIIVGAIVMVFTGEMILVGRETNCE